MHQVADVLPKYSLAENLNLLMAVGRDLGAVGLPGEPLPNPTVWARGAKDFMRGIDRWPEHVAVTKLAALDPSLRSHDPRDMVSGGRALQAAIRGITVGPDGRPNTALFDRLLDNYARQVADLYHAQYEGVDAAYRAAHNIPEPPSKFTFWERYSRTNGARLPYAATENKVWVLANAMDEYGAKKPEHLDRVKNILGYNDELLRRPLPLPDNFYAQVPEEILLAHDLGLIRLFPYHHDSRYESGGHIYVRLVLGVTVLINGKRLMGDDSGDVACFTYEFADKTFSAGGLVEVVEKTGVSGSLQRVAALYGGAHSPELGHGQEGPTHVSQ
jgi:hypothetical protein